MYIICLLFTNSQPIYIKTGLTIVFVGLIMYPYVPVKKISRLSVIVRCMCRLVFKDLAILCSSKSSVTISYLFIFNCRNQASVKEEGTEVGCLEVYLDIEDKRKRKVFRAIRESPNSNFVLRKLQIQASQKMEVKRRVETEASKSDTMG